MGGRLLRTAAAVVVLVVAACTDDNAAVTPPLPPDLPPYVTGAPEQPPVADYALLGLSCGEVERSIEGHVPDAVVQCFLAAVAAGRPAHMVVTGYTIEGDRVFSAFQVVGKDRVAAVDDSRWDAFGSGQITRSVCHVGAEPATTHVSGDGGSALVLGACR